MDIVSSAVLEAQHFALSKSEEARSCHDQLDGAEEHMDLFHEKAISLEAARAEATV